MMHVREVLQVAREALTSALSTLTHPQQRTPVLGAVVDEFIDLRLPARNDLGIEFVHIPRLGAQSGIPMYPPHFVRSFGATEALVKVQVTSPSVSGFVLMMEGDARKIEWELERQVAMSGLVSEIPAELYTRLTGKKSTDPTDV